MASPWRAPLSAALSMEIEGHDLLDGGAVSRASSARPYNLCPRWAGLQKAALGPEIEGYGLLDGGAVARVSRASPLQPLSEWAGLQKAALSNGFTVESAAFSGSRHGNRGTRFARRLLRRRPGTASYQGGNPPAPGRRGRRGRGRIAGRTRRGAAAGRPGR